MKLSFDFQIMAQHSQIVDQGTLELIKDPHSDFYKTAAFLINLLHRRNCISSNYLKSISNG